MLQIEYPNPALAEELDWWLETAEQRRQPYRRWRAQQNAILRQQFTFDYRDRQKEKRDELRRKLFIRNAPHKVVARELRKEIEQFGDLFESRIPLMAERIVQALELRQSEAKEEE